MGYYDSDGEYKAKTIYLMCPFCGEKSWLKVRRVTWFSVSGIEEQAYSLRCEKCNLVFGENIFNEPQYETESDLIADWNCRKY